MKNKKNLAILSFFLFILVFFSGCTDLFKNEDNTSLYELHENKISYNIAYGYNITCSGNGEHGIIYDCDEPEVLKGNVEITNVLNDEYTNKTGVATFNNMKSWNINKKGLCKNYKLGIKANVISENYLINDLNGKDALSIDEINYTYPDLVNQYCQPQKNKTTVYIDPNNPTIKDKSLEIYNSAKSNNSFIVAKELFIWLKQNTAYIPHSDNNYPQPATITFQKKTGDCDDLTFLYLSLCKALNIPSRFIRGFLLKDEYTAESHVWAEVFVGNIGENGWIPVECAGANENPNEIQSEIHQHFGLESSDHLRLYKDNGSSKSLNISLSGIYYSYDTNIDFEKPLFFADISNYTVLEEKKLFVDENNYRTYIN